MKNADSTFAWAMLYFFLEALKIIAPLFFSGLDPSTRQAGATLEC